MYFNSAYTIRQWKLICDLLRACILFMESCIYVNYRANKFKIVHILRKSCKYFYNRAYLFIIRKDPHKQKNSASDYANRAIQSYYFFQKSDASIFYGVPTRLFTINRVICPTLFEFLFSINDTHWVPTDKATRRNILMDERSC